MAAGANPVLKHYRTATIPSVTATAVSTAPAAGRALVISKLTVVNISGASLSFALYLGAATAADLIAYTVNLAAGESYTETGLIALAGEQVFIYNFTAGANSMAVNVFGEEVDAS